MLICLLKQVYDNLRSRHDPAKLFSSAFKTAHSARPDLFLNCISLSNLSKSVPFPSLFELQAALSLHDEALKESNRAFSGEIPFPEPPFSGRNTPLDAALETIFDVELEIPSFENLNLPEISAERVTAVVDKLLEWINTSVMLMESSKAVMVGKFPSDYLLKMIRALAFVYSAEPDRFDQAHSLYARISNCIAALAIYRYFVNVMKPLGRGISKDVERRSASVKELAENLNELIKLWLAYMSSYISSSFPVSVNYDLHCNTEYSLEGHLAF